MNHVIESFAWCMVQVTLFALAAAAAYWLARRWHTGGFVAMLAASLAIVGTLTLLVWSPYPRWRFDSDLPSAVAEVDAASPTDSSTSRLTPTSVERSATANVSIAPDLVDGIRQPLLPVKDIATEVAPAAKPFRVWPLVIIFAWTTSAVGFFRLMFGAAQMRRVRLASVPLVDSSVTSVAKELQEHLGIKPAVRLCECPQLGVPATFGWWRPLVLLPATWQNWTREQRRAVLAHELAHIRERHFATWMIAQVSLAAHFYHPLVHWLTRRLRLEQELAADALAAATFADRRQYTSALASLALGPMQPARLSTPLGLYMSRPLLMRRIAMLRQSNERPRRNAAWKFAALLAGICLTAIVAAGCRPAANTTEPEMSNAAELLSGGIPVPLDPQHSKRAVILYKVDRQVANPLEEQTTMSDSAWNTFCRTQLAAIKSTWVLQAALRDPQVANLPLVKSQSQPIAWLRQRLQVGFDSGSELMYILMHCTSDEVRDARQIVNAVSKAYEDEYIFGDKNQKLAIIDALRKSRSDLDVRIRRDTQKYLNLAHELGSSAADGGISAQVSMKQLDRVEAELLRVQNAMFEASFGVNESNMEAYKNKVELYTQQTKVLNDSREKLRSELNKASEPSVELSELKNKLEQSQQLSNELSRKLQALEVEANAPAQIKRMYSEAMTDEVAAR